MFRHMHVRMVHSTFTLGLCHHYFCMFSESLQIQINVAYCWKSWGQCWAVWPTVQATPTKHNNKLEKNDIYSQFLLLLISGKINFDPHTFNTLTDPQPASHLAFFITGISLISPSLLPCLFQKLLTLLPQKRLPQLIYLLNIHGSVSWL